MDAVRAAIEADPKVARQARVVGAAAGRAMQPALVLLKEAGADLNASWRNYRPLHNLLQGEPHAAAGKPRPRGWRAWSGCSITAPIPNNSGRGLPRAIIVAAFVGSPEYVKLLPRAARRRCMSGRISRATGIMAA